ncbi:MAG: OmpH family outer membrane protein [Thermodesulfobacteriota bacterium]
MKKRILILIGIIIGLMVAGQSWAEEKTKIAILNIQKILTESEVGKKTKDDLSSKFKNLQEKINKKQDELEKFRQDLEKKTAVISAEARDEKEREYQKQYREFKQLYEDAQYEMQQAERKATEPLIKSLQTILEKFGKEQGYTLILDPVRSGVVYAADDIDVTDKILDLFNKENKVRK